MINGFDTLFKWALAALTTLWALSLGHIHVRINRVEDKREVDMAAQEIRRAKFWSALEENKEQVNELRLTLVRDYPTKVDLKETEDRIIAAVKSR